MIPALFAAIAVVTGTTCLYLAAPHQALLARVPDTRILLLAGIAGLAAALGLLLTLMGSATAVFTWVVAMMVLWTVPPIVIRWIRFRRENAR